MTLEVFKKAFLRRFFHRMKAEAKLVELINIHEGGMSMVEYSFKFTQF